jgi:DNA-directed RNA polymerase alpha subunit
MNEFLSFNITEDKISEDIVINMCIKETAFFKFGGAHFAILCKKSIFFGDIQDKKSRMEGAINQLFHTFLKRYEISENPDHPDYKVCIKSLLDEQIDTLEISVRAYNCFVSLNIKTIRDLIQHTESDLLRVPNFGRKSLNEVKNILADLRLSLRDPHD